jgi:hypothetical protein
MEALAWLFWQVGGLGPMAGQNHHFKQYAPKKLNYAIERYVNETNRLYCVPALSWRGITRSRTWRPILGLSRTKTKARSSTSFCI